ncbi:hypothetical protein HELRODRAFT_136106, partial [Helobdella robusta]|uniref:PHD-type domain-containing protein n=1 Tax=Helobdella robusta TaxID=6412 RepID=T1EIC1_HELRO
LLKCDVCQDSYHAKCLSDNHPTEPSKNKQIWVCSKCVRCRSCGTRVPTPINTSSSSSLLVSLWSHDFSLCYTCGDMMDKGNFCPVCHKCYQEDDWESQMIQCSSCNSWVHAKCEQLNDEMYQVVVHMAEDVPFTCKEC